jgi:hypothetical protein
MPAVFKDGMKADVTERNKVDGDSHLSDASVSQETDDKKRKENRKIKEP